MASDAERRLEEMGWPLEEVDFGREDDPDLGGCAVAGVVRNEGIRVRIAVRPGISEEFRADFAAWAERRVEGFMDHGPVPDGWQRRCDGNWQIWGRRVELPPM
ncbi:hypothetical protein [Actinacidiphila acidipaludis]|uniref:Uncharacterized protein n=1 Tax=Actinacidiphila acidipaludis TaxID=2873382 RepID=A0ABS7Q2E0_9ACTN|nr:hypothetical protein [Streptomyces acidipaludis]MBY8877297.1 hypothetical protein [Streptomyces acidipaludis]